MTLLEAALYYASLGWAVFPLRTKDKRPLTANGCKDASKEAAQIKAWWKQYPNANIGIATGLISGFFVIDLDVDEEKDKNGIESLNTWQMIYDDLPRTVTAITGRNGRHLLYRCSCQIKNRVDILSGIDLRGDGGYIVAPPSIHPNGNSYKWIDSLSPKDLAIAEPNQSVFKLVENSTPNVTHESGETFPEGQRTSSLVAMIASMKGKNFPRETIEAAIRSTNEKCCAPPLTEKELKKEVLPAIDRLEPGSGNYKKDAPPKSIEPLTGAELQALELPPLVYIVDELLPEGTGSLTAPPKYFKSYMMLGLFFEICTGGTFLGKKCQKHGCLYFDLESNKRRPKQRLEQIANGRPFPSNLYIVTAEQEVPALGNGFEQQLEMLLDAHPDIKVVGIDVLQKIRPPQKGNKNAYDRDYDDIKPLKQITDRRGITLIVVHHNNKTKSKDPFDQISGSTGFTGSLDYLWIIEKSDRWSNEAVISITGRDIESQRLKIKFDTETYQWQYIGTEEDIERQRLEFEYQQSPIVSTVKKLLDTHDGEWEGSASDLIEASKAFGDPIEDDVRSVGAYLGKYTQLFFNEFITITQGKRVNNKRVFKIRGNV